MAKTYEAATAEDYALAKTVLETYHKELLDCEARICLTIVRKFTKDDEVVPCLRFAGAQAAAIVRPTPAAKKLYLEMDAEVVIDGAIWDSLSNASRLALLDHEFTHLEPVRNNKTNEPRKDDRGHQILKTRRDDFMLTGFVEIVKRHGKAALEYGNVVNTSAAVEAALQEFIDATAPPAQATAPQVPG